MKHTSNADDANKTVNFDLGGSKNEKSDVSGLSCSYSSSQPAGHL